MGLPRLSAKDIPVKTAKESLVQEPLLIDGKTYAITIVSMGNPHCVIYVKDVARFPVADIGPKIENHRIFPKRINVEFVQIISPTEVRQRTWERGSGETLACGTGASAVCVAGVLTGKTGPRITNHLLGGTLLLEWTDKNGPVFKTGPCVEVFSGEIKL
jgi:diaminopimelate epimerase